MWQPGIRYTANTCPVFRLSVRACRLRLAAVSFDALCSAFCRAVASPDLQFLGVDVARRACAKPALCMPVVSRRRHCASSREGSLITDDGRPSVPALGSGSSGGGCETQHAVRMSALLFNSHAALVVSVRRRRARARARGPEGPVSISTLRVFRSHLGFGDRHTSCVLLSLSLSLMIDLRLTRGGLRCRRHYRCRSRQ